jgi:predicted nucleic acid-binding protein
MKMYADTSFLVRLLVRDADNEAALAAHRRIGRPFLIYTSFHDLELTNALRLRIFAVADATSGIKRQARKDHEEAQRRLKTCLTKGLFQSTPMPWDAAVERAVELSASYSQGLGTRSFDLFHVGAALELRFKEFITCDLRQASLAKAAGLKVVLVRREV